jgi:hypothetical protein
VFQKQEATMNNFKIKKVIVMALTFVLVITWADLPLSAKERRVSMVVVTMADGSQIKGELLVVKADALLVYDSDAGQGKSLNLQQVVQVKVLKKSKFLTGMAIGYGIGFGTFLFGYIQSHGKGLLGLDLIFILSAIPGLCGGLLGSLVSIPRKISMSGTSYQQKQENIERLKRYAREQDVEKPAVD